MEAPVRRFVTGTGIEVVAITTDQMRQVDRVAIEVTGPNLYQMMENAGRNLAQATIEVLGDNWRWAQVAVLAGPGGNGGGAICAARHLANRDVDVIVVITDAERITPVPAYQLEIYRAAGGVVAALTDLDRLRPDVVLDGIIGYSLQGAPLGEALQMIEWAGRAGCPAISLDVPSGVDSTTGVAGGACVRPVLTMTLALPKTGLVPARTGELQLADLGIPRAVYEALGISYRAPFEAAHRVALYPLERSESVVLA